MFLYSVYFFFTFIVKIFAVGENCEVCVKVLTEFSMNLTKDDLTSPGVIADKFTKFCWRAKGPENRLCYYVGGLEQSAAKILPEITKPLTWGMPADKICSRLKQKDSQICEIRYKKPVNFSKEHLMALKISDLKKILNDLGAYCHGCLEKIDFVNTVMSLKSNTKSVLKERVKLYEKNMENIHICNRLASFGEKVSKCAKEVSYYEK